MEYNAFMTVCIAAIAEEKYIVAITDKMLTVGPQPVTKYEIDKNNKTIGLNTKTIGLFAGEVISANEIINSVKNLINDNQTVKEIADIINGGYKSYWKSLIDNYLGTRYGGLTSDVFMGNHPNFDSNFVNETTKVLMQFSLDNEIIIAGLDPDNTPHLFIINNGGTVQSFDPVGYAFIGSGSKHAQLSLIENEYDSTFSISKSLYSLLEAKKRAEYDPGVGDLCDVTLVNSIVQKFDKTKMEGVKSIFKKSCDSVRLIKDQSIDEISKII